MATAGGGVRADAEKKTGYMCTRIAMSFWRLSAPVLIRGL
jgi:hypothetical protein